MWYPWEKTTWKSYLYLQNTTPDQANLTITYCYQDSPTTCRTETDVSSLPPFGSARVDPGSEMGNFFWGFARVQSTNGKELAVVVTQEEDAAGASDYNAFSAGATTLYLPSLMYMAWNKTWSSAFVVQNLGAQTTSVNVLYFDEDGRQRYGCRLTNLRAGASCLVKQDGYVSGCSVGPLSTPTSQAGFAASCAVPEGWHGTAKLASPYPIAGIHNLARKPVQDDYGASYNLVQR